MSKKYPSCVRSIGALGLLSAAVTACASVRTKDISGAEEIRPGIERHASSALFEAGEVTLRFERDAHSGEVRVLRLSNTMFRITAEQVEAVDAALENYVLMPWIHFSNSSGHLNDGQFVGITLFGAARDRNSYLTTRLGLIDDGRVLIDYFPANVTFELGGQVVD